LGGKKKEEPQEEPQKPTFKEEDFNDDIPF